MSKNAVSRMFIFVDIMTAFRAIVTILQALLVCLIAGSFAASFVPVGAAPLLQVLPSLDTLIWIGNIVLLIVGRMVKAKPALPAVGLVLATSLLVARSIESRSPAAMRSGPVVRLLNLNVRQLSNDTAVVQETIRLLRALDPDIVCFQEFGLYYKWPEVEVVARDFAQRLEMEHYECSPHPGNIFGTALFSKYPIVRTDTLFSLLSHTNEAKRYTLSVQGVHWHLTNAHLQSFNVFGRRNDFTLDAFIQSIMDRSVQAHIVASIPSDVIVGDFNASPGSEAYRQFNEGYIDAMRLKDLALIPTHNRLPTRLDYVFVRPEVEVRSVEVLRRFPSDHAAILVTLVL